MDPITLAIVGALGHLGESVIKDAYEALKAAIANKCGVQSDLTLAVESLEKKPDSNGRQETLKEEIAGAKVDQDADILKAAEILLEKLQTFTSQHQGVQQTIIGNGNVFSGTGDVKVSDHPRKK